MLGNSPSVEIQARDFRFCRPCDLTGQPHAKLTLNTSWRRQLSRHSITSSATEVPGAPLVATMLSFPALGGACETSQSRPGNHLRLGPPSLKRDGSVPGTLLPRPVSLRSGPLVKMNVPRRLHDRRSPIGPKADLGLCIRWS